MKRRLRIAVGRINQETNALSPVRTTLADFQRTHYRTGAELLASLHPLRAEVPGMFRNVELSGFARRARAYRHAEVELVPLVSAWAISGGPLERACFDAIVTHTTDALRAAGPVDGVFLALHGAMGVVGVQDPEDAIVRAVKAAAPGIPVAASFDLHGNLTRERVASTDVICAYHTNPHRDHAATGARAASVLLDKLTGRADVRTAWRSLPILLGGGTTVDLLPPMRKVFARIRAMKKLPRVLDASLFMVHPWNDHPELGWSVVVHTDGDAALAETLADELAEMAWACRHEQPPVFASAEQAVADARRATLARKFGTVTLADASDVVTAGSIGESTELLRVLLRDGQGMLAYVPVRDADVVAQFWDRAPGDEIDVRVGGKIDTARTQPVPVRARLRSKHGPGPFGRVVVLDAGTIRLCVTEQAPLAMRPAFFADLGLAPRKADVIVVKNFFPFRMFFLLLSRKTLYVKTGGITDFDAAYGLPFAGPLHPRDVVTDWRETDRRRRAAAR